MRTAPHTCRAVYWGNEVGVIRIETESVEGESGARVPADGIPTGMRELRLVNTLDGNRARNFSVDFWRIFNALNPRSFRNRFWVL